MKSTKRAACTAAMLLTSGLALAQEVHIWNDPGGWAGQHWIYSPSPLLYSGKELSFDAFGSYLARERHLSKLFDTNIRHGTWGGGVGLNYFLTRYVGIGGDINIPDNGGKFIDDAIGNLMLRAPLGGSGLAPYVFGGGGRGFDPAWEWLADAGVGLELRLNPLTGIFVDGRYIWADKSYDRAEFRAGFRFVF
jgi:hypothetical protein